MTENHVELMAPLWADYQLDAYEQLLPPGEQHTECKRAFYGGAAKVMMALEHLSSDGAEPTLADLALHDQLMAELNAFFEAESAIHKVMN